MAARDTSSQIFLQSLKFSQANSVSQNQRGEDKHNSHSPRRLHPPSPHHFTSAALVGAAVSPKIHKQHFTLASYPLSSTMEDHLHHNSSSIENHNIHTTNNGNGNVIGVNTATTALRSTYNDWQNRWESSTVITTNTSLDMDLNLVGKGSRDGSTSVYGSNNGHNSPYDESNIHNKCHRYSGSITAICICACAFFTPLLMIFLPKLNPISWKVSECGPECDGPLISLSFKLLLLLISSWLLFARKRGANLPRIDLYRCIILALIMLLLLSYWLFFLVRSSERFIADYEVPFKELLISYPVPLVENLLLVHYLAVLLMEIRHRRKIFYVKVVRSPDGSTRSYTIGDLSIQRAAVFILEKYYKDFPVYNPFLDSSHLPFGMANDNATSRTSGTFNGRIKKNQSNTLGGDVGTNGGDLIGNGGPKFYDLDGNSTSTPNSNLLGGSNIFTSSTGRNNNSTIGNSSTHTLYSMRVNQLGSERTKSHSVVGTERATSDSHRRGSKRPGGSVRGSSSHHHSHNDRFHEEYEFERRVKKRRARLVTSAEEAFTHIKLVADDHQGEKLLCFQCV